MEEQPLLIKNQEVPLRQFGKGCICKLLLDDEKGLKNLTIGTVIIEPGERTVTHTRVVEEVVFAHKGEVYAVTENAEYRLSEGDCIFIPADITHYHENRSNETIEQIFIFSPQGPEKDMRKLPLIERE